MAQRYHANNPAAPQLFHSSLPPLVPPTEQLGGMKDRFLSIPLSPLLLTPPPPLAVRSKGIQTAVTDLQTAVQPAVYQSIRTPQAPPLPLHLNSGKPSPQLGHKRGGGWGSRAEGTHWLHIHNTCRPENVKQVNSLCI